MWKKISRDEVKKLGHRLVQTKWVFCKKVEADGKIRAKSRIVSKGFMQIPGVDYLESFSPVARDCSVRIAFGLALHLGWNIDMIDVEAAFLNGELKTRMFLEWPEGLVELGFLTDEEARTTCIDLQKSMYGNVDAALLWQETIRKFFLKIGLKQSCADPCIYYKRVGDNMCLLVVVYVDDMLFAGPTSEIAWCKEQLSSEYKINDLGSLKKHLGIHYHWNTNSSVERMLVANMDGMANEIVEKYKKVTGRYPVGSNTPGIPGKSLAKNQGETIMLEDYRSIVGKVMYYTTKIAPECSNAARELVQHMSNPGNEHWIAMERMCGYIKAKGKHEIVYCRPKELKVICFADSDYAKNSDDCCSVSGHVTTLGGMITTWVSKTQNSVTLSSTEAEYVSLASCAQEVIFMQMLLDEVWHCKKPGLIYEDNTGAIFLVKNAQVGLRTKHIDIRHHFIRELWQKGLINVEYIKSEDNVADVLTKNVTVDLFGKLVPGLLSGMIIG